MRRPAALLAVVLLLAPPVALAQAPIPSPAQSPGAEGCVPIADFSKAKLGAFPPDWKPRKDDGYQVYSVVEEAGLRFLRAVSRGLGIQAARQFDTWDLAAQPVLAWSWRPREFPKGADERDSSTNDSPLAVYMLVPYSRIVGPKAVKYVWSEKVPVGTRLSSNAGLTQVLVLRTGNHDKDAWVEERVNALEDYRKLFGDTGTPKPVGIAVLTDSDDTKSSAAGDYANFRVCRR